MSFNEKDEKEEEGFNLTLAPSFIQSHMLYPGKSCQELISTSEGY